ncbi:hypothetical protein GS425_10970 [Rhodococcus hoagii]|nr:hypothetical protein [Prescottella equi]
MFRAGRDHECFSERTAPRSGACAHGRVAAGGGGDIRAAVADPGAIAFALGRSPFAIFWLVVFTGLALGAVAAILPSSWSH